MRIRIDCLPEPRLMFGGGLIGFEPRRALAASGPVDSGSLHDIRLGLVGLEADVSAARRWLERFNQFLPAREGNAFRYRNWPGSQRALGVRFLVEDRFVRTLDQSRVDIVLNSGASGERFSELLDLFTARIVGLFADARPDCVVVCLPVDIADLKIENPGLTPGERAALERLRAEEEDDQLMLFQPSPEELRAAEELRTQADDLLFRTFYRALKASVMTHINPVPLQILRRDTIERPDEDGQSHATRAWNLAVSLYYKAGGLPWRPADLPENVCFVGVSFHHLKRRSGNLVYASVAQAFSTHMEPFALKGATVDHEQRRNRQPYLNTHQASALMQDVLDQYEARAGILPSRVVIHKTTAYQPEEEQGFRAATQERVPACDLVWMRSTPFRLVRKGTQEPWRGTLCTVGQDTYLFTSGFVPYWNEYPGPHIPAPVQIGSAGETDLRQRATEILALTKMNWNTSEGMSRYPITLSFAKKVGQLMSELAENQIPNPSYRFYM
ncbi:MAG: hypothetical protein ABUT39_14165 [Acidobacteriota bacterium]